MTTLVRMFHRGSGRANWGTFAERVRAYHGVCGSLAGDLAFSCAAFVAFAVCAGTETAITTLWPWKVREYAQREWEKDRRAFHKNQTRNMIDAPNASKCFVRLKVGQQFFFVSNRMRRQSKGFLRCVRVEENALQPRQGHRC